MPAYRKLPRQRIVARYRAGDSFSTLSRAFGVSSSTLHLRFKEWGEPTRSPAQARRLRDADPDTAAVREPS